MKINTKYHGEVEIEQKDVISFDFGIPGFPDEKEYVILPLAKESVFFILQSFKTEELAFIISDPFIHFSEYQFDIPIDDLETLKIEQKEDVVTFSIITLVEPIEETTANLQAPLLINRNINKGKQLILNDTLYSTKHRIYRKKSSTGQEG
ncbi:flagellar assembly protein FliW [Fredinandcohnia sp. QZ13]|uniref:flagellar assembly protein FliW n=1 Tax=Fredinandcohnia sp. QZ13 TaxID=3073144 RepID=UPI0028532FA5|nr:flagellar assembly protein FliW [Fredinandcohnia sp. QZ13]MDR4889996.1 flagellar assembly protein FliW [Fredinandcohnia sp. QZ13]